ncbi:hypothetical protein AB0368_25285 [Actinoplanes sp. NPDC051475]|uniref:hypothetical protein n=1 Tax=Actinoplanes sp. NPDC051475 TaxID=3157225 RepID=UPI00344C497B
MSTDRPAVSVRATFERLTGESRNPMLLSEHAAHARVNGSWTASVSYLDGLEGSAEVQRCEHCPFVFVACEHSRCSWDEHGIVLTCDLCGRDVT